MAAQTGGLNDLERSAFDAPLESPALDNITRISMLCEISTAISAKRQADALERIAAHLEIEITTGVDITSYSGSVDG